MTDPIPAAILKKIEEWSAQKRPCEIKLNMAPDGTIKNAKRVIEEIVRA